jgi:transposase
MSDDALFDVTPPTGDQAEVADDRVRRYETVNREQIELVPTDLEGLLPPGHAARLVWRFIEGLDLRAFYAPIKAYEGGVGRTPIDPKILIALWLYATIDGVGRAREVDRLCYSHDAYRWIRGGVSVNYHTLSDFRIDHQAALNDLLTQSITVLLHRGVVTMARVAQDGTRVRGSAGAGSFRRRPTLEEARRAARKQVERTVRQPDRPGRSREAAAEARAARERLARVEEALAQLPQIEAIKHKQGKKASEPRVSTTDPDARVMKMADGGYRPAYNVQFATDVDSRTIVGVAVSNEGHDRTALAPMLHQIEQRTGHRPAVHLVDGGFVNKDVITEVAATGVTVYAPLFVRAGRKRELNAPVAGDSPAVEAWRARMASDEGRQLYKARSATAEWVNADGRAHRVLNHIPVRGAKKVLTWATWIALAHNLIRTMELVPHLMT